MDLSEVNGYGTNYMEYRVLYDGMDSDLSPCSRDSLDTASSASPPMSVTVSPRTYHHLERLGCGDETMDGQLGTMYGDGEPVLRIVEEPVEKFRFRYLSEVNGVHGAINGRRKTKANRTYPTVELLNWYGPAIVRCSLFTAQKVIGERSPSCHQLVVEGKQAVDGNHSIRVNVEDVGNTACFSKMSIIHTAKKDKLTELKAKLRQRRLEEKRRISGPNAELTVCEKSAVDQLAAKQAGDSKLNNTVSLFFECFDEGMQPICEPVFSGIIANMKSAETNELKITRFDKGSSTCLGKEEIFMLVEKVNKKHVKVRFFEMDPDEDVEVWSDFATFTELDVHHQYAIVFKTPAYRRLDIVDSVDVFMELCRSTDGAKSDPVPFQYRPCERRTARNRKIARRDSNAEPELPTAAASSAAAVAADPMMGGGFAMPTPTATYVSTTLSIEEVLNAPLVTDFELSSLANITDFSWITNMDEDLATDSGAVSAKPPPPPPGEPCADPERNGDERLGADQLMRKVHRGCEETRKQRRAATGGIFESFRRLCSLQASDGCTAAHIAVDGEDPATLELLLQEMEACRCVDLLNIANDAQQTALHAAVCSDQPAVVGALLDIGADVDVRDGRGRSSLHLAVELSHDRCLRQLLNSARAKPNLEAKDDEGRTALHVAATRCNAAAARQLIAAGADAMRRDREGRTPLLLACQEGDFDIAEMLVKGCNVDVEAKDFAGITAFDISKAIRSPRLLSLLDTKACRWGRDRGASASDEEEDEDEFEDEFEDAESNPTESEADDGVDALTRGVTRQLSVGLSALPAASRRRLCAFLDERLRWKALAERLGFGFLVGGIDGGNVDSPAKTVVNYADLNGVDVATLRAHLRQLDDSSEALAIVDGF